MDQRRPLVTIIVPNFNYGHALAPCLKAAREQTYEPIELIVADDCSTDDSVEVAQRYGARVVSTAANGGAATARNLGAAHASGEVLMFVDSDVALRPDAVANAVAILLSDPEIGTVCGTYDSVPLTRTTMIKEYRCLHQYYWMNEAEGTSSFHSALFAIDADLFAEVGPFDPQLRHTEDGDFAYRLSQHRRILCSTAVQGRHDHDDTLRLVLRKVFHRTRLHIPLYLRRRALSGGAATGPRAGASVAAFLALPALALPVALGPLWWPMPLALLCLSVVLDLGLYRFVRRTRGTAFGLYFTGVHFIANVTVGAAAATGVIQWLSSGSFRRLYDATYRGKTRQEGNVHA